MFTQETAIKSNIRSHETFNWSFCSWKLGQQDSNRLVLLILDVFLLVLFTAQWIFNYGIVLPFTAKILNIDFLPTESMKAVK